MVDPMVYLFSFLIGFVCGLRSMTAPAVIAWGARLGWLHLDGSPLAFLANQISLVVFSLFALGELIADKLPFIPRRILCWPWWRMQLLLVAECCWLPRQKVRSTLHFLASIRTWQSKALTRSLSVRGRAEIRSPMHL
jgi:hypothetical protein